MRSPIIVLFPKQRFVILFLQIFRQPHTVRSPILFILPSSVTQDYVRNETSEATVITSLALIYELPIQTLNPTNVTTPFQQTLEETICQPQHTMEINTTKPCKYTHTRIPKQTPEDIWRVWQTNYTGNNQISLPHKMDTTVLLLLHTFTRGSQDATNSGQYSSLTTRDTTFSVVPPFFEY